MCDSGPIQYREDTKCSICEKSPAFYLDDDNPMEEDAYCQKCGLEIFGKEIMTEMSFM